MCPEGHIARAIYGTGWRRLIGSPKLQIIFHKRATKYKSLLRKMTYKDKRSYESSPPCIYIIYIARAVYIPYMYIAHAIYTLYICIVHAIYILYICIA